jgi:hypothetical protein
VIPAPVAAVLMALTLTAGAPAVRDATVQLGPAVATTAEVVATGRCAQWEQTALDVGWPVEQWPTIDRVMWCESHCEPGAHNRSGASGLMQVMPGWWAGRDPFDPATNLTMALEVHAAQGWRAWSCR